MADIVLPYTYTDAVAFNATSHSTNMYSLTSGASMFGELNGGLTIVNFHSGFRLLAEHVMPSHNAYMLTESGKKPFVIVDNMLSTVTEDDISFTAIPGVAQHFFCESTRNTVEFMWQIYYHAFRFIGALPQSAYEKSSIVFMAYIDGAPIYSTRHKVAITTLIDMTSSPGSINSNEASGAQTLSQSYFANSLARGHHYFEVRCWLEQTRSDETVYTFFRGSNPASYVTVAPNTGTNAGGYSSDWATAYASALAGFEHVPYNRLTLGVRNLIITMY